MQQRATCPFCQGMLADRRQEFCASCRRRIVEEGKAEKNYLRLTLLLAILGAVSSFIIGLLANSHPVQGYLPASCTILAHHQHIYRTSATRPETYVPSLTYTVSAPPEKPATAQGYAGPDPENFDSYSGLQRVLDAFSLGETYPCWYPKGHIEKAVLVLHKDAVRPWFLALMGATSFPLVALAVALLLLLLQTWNVPKVLYTRGTVIKRIQTEKRLQAIVAFPLASDPEVQCTTIIEKDLPLESSVELEYPPHKPTQAVFFDPFPSSLIPGRIILVGAIVLALVLPMLYLQELFRSLALF